MPRQVENNDAETARDLGIVQQRAILPSVGAGGVQADQRDALPCFLEVEAMRPAVQVESQVTADGRLDDRRTDCGHRLCRCRRTQRGKELLEEEQVAPE